MNITNFFSVQNKERICIVSEDRSWTYGEIDAWIKAVCVRLMEAGFYPGCVLAHTFQNDFRSLICQLAVAKMGGTVLSVSFTTPALRAKEMIALCKADFLATDMENIAYPGLRTIWIDFDCRKLPPVVEANDLEAESPAAPWIVVSGSGSTGKPKLMPVTHAQQLARMRSGLQWLPYSAEDTFASLIHLDFYATKQRYLEAFFKGASVYLLANESQSLFQLVDSGRVSALYGTVFHIEKLLRSVGAARPNNLERLNALMIGGSTVPMSLRKKITEQLCSKLYVLHGANESHTTCITMPSEVLLSPGNVGRPHDGFMLEIVDTMDHPLPADQVGQIRIKSDAMIDGYQDDARASAAAFRGGWFYPGDLGKMTEDGQLIHLGRSDDLMIRNGINIYPSEIEHILASHPAVEDAFALPLKHPIHQDIPICVVTLKHGESASESALHKYCLDRLGSHGPRQVFIVEQFPCNEQGKVLREELLKLLRQRLDAAAARADRRQKMKLDALLSPDLSFNVEIHLPREFSLKAVDAWLVEGMGISRAELNLTSKKVFGNEVKAAEVLLLRVLLLARVFLNLGKLPVFDCPKILSIEANKRDSRKFRASVSLASVGNMPHSVYQIAVKSSFNLLQWMIENPINVSNREKLYATVQEKIIPPLNRLIPAGKSTLPVLRVAHALGIPFIHLGLGVYQLGWGSRARRMDRSTTDLDSAIGSKLSQNKVSAASLLRMAGLPSPVHLVVRSETDAISAAQKVGYPVVVKPSDRDRGEGVTVDILEREALIAAFRHAYRMGRNKQVIVERQVDGVCHRLFIADSRLLYAVKRLPMSVKGDGIHSVSWLVNEEVARQTRLPPWNRTEIRPIDEQALAAMRGKGFHPEMIPNEGALVPLRRIESTEWGGVDEDVSESVHRDNILVAIRAAELFGLHVAGIDIISPDLSVPWYENGAIVNEVNFAPLFGGGEISKSHIPAFLNKLVKGDGKIPVEIFDGSAATELASARHGDLINNKLRSFLVTDAQTLDYRKQILMMPLRSVEDRVKALLCRPDVDSLVVAV